MSSRTSSPSLLSRDRMIGGCRIERLIGTGGMGQVYLAYHAALEKRVALKLLPPGDESPRRVERFLTEARVGSRIEHPNVITLHDAGVEDGLYYILLQYIDGRNASQLVADRGGPLEWRSAVRLVRRACRGLQAVHDKGIVHRDVKPANIMLSREQRVLLMDFGLVHITSGDERGLQRSIVGTPAFMSPEQCGDGRIDAASDVYSMACTLYYLLTSKAPYRGSTRDIMRQVTGGVAAPPIEEFNGAVPRFVSSFIAGVMTPRERRSVRTADRMAEELEGLLRRADVSEATTCDFAEISRSDEMPTIEPLGEFVELVPAETVWDRLTTLVNEPRYLTALAAGGAALVLVLIALILMAQR